MTNEKFLYFSFGSNLSIERIRINNKSANFFCVGVLKGYRFAFQGYSKYWKGSTANIYPDQQSQVYGILWEMDQNDLENLDRQELHYTRIEVEVNKVNSDESYTCWTYTEENHYKQLVDEDGRNDRPSLKYKQLVINGAKLNQFPDYYLKMLEDYDDNGEINCGPQLKSLDNQIKI